MWPRRREGNSVPAKVEDGFDEYAGGISGKTREDRAVWAGLRGSGFQHRHIIPSAKRNGVKSVLRSAVVLATTSGIALDRVSIS